MANKLPQDTTPLIYISSRDVYVVQIQNEDQTYDLNKLVTIKSADCTNSYSLDDYIKINTNNLDYRKPGTYYINVFVEEPHNPNIAMAGFYIHVLTEEQADRLSHGENLNEDKSTNSKLKKHRFFRKRNHRKKKEKGSVLQRLKHRPDINDLKTGLYMIIGLLIVMAIMWWFDDMFQW